MKKVNARAANQGFSALLSEVEAGEEILITKHGRPGGGSRPVSSGGHDRRAAEGHWARHQADGKRAPLGRWLARVHARRDAREMSVSFDTNVLVYATATSPGSKSMRARELIARAMRAGSSVLLLQSLAEFSNVAIRKAGIKVEAVQAVVAGWEAALPVEAAQRDDLPAALDAVKAHRLAFWDAML